MRLVGVVTEWLKVLAWKAGVPYEGVPRVRIPPTPQQMPLYQYQKTFY